MLGTTFDWLMTIQMKMIESISLFPYEDLIKKKQ